MSELTNFKYIAGIALAILSCVASLTLAWKGRYSFEPCEEDIPKAPQKVGSLISALIIIYLIFVINSGKTEYLENLLCFLIIGAFFFLIIYLFLVGMYTYKKIEINKKSPNGFIDKKIIGGFRLTKHARKTINEKQITIQKFFAGTAYDSDEVWTRDSRCLAKTLFVVSYIGLIGCCTIGLALASLLICLLEFPLIKPIE